MQKGRKSLPPLDYLLAFQVTGKTGSFTSASKELNISESSISRKVKLLEQHYGVQLFNRGHRSISITPEGFELLSSVSQAIDIMREASSRLLEKESYGSITLAATNSVASLWIMPRLNNFQAVNPNLNIAIVSSDDDEECMAESNDLVILRGNGNWPNFHSELLFGETVFPVCSPDFLANNPDVTSKKYIENMDLIDVASSHLEWMNWTTWLKSHHLNSPQSSMRTIVNTYPLAVQAAVDGLGVALGWQHLVDRYLESGKLLCPLGDKHVKTSDGYYLLVPKNAKSSKERDVVRNWLLQISRESEKTFSNIKIKRPYLKSVS